jgi:lambda family phage tail tape measure protein
MATDKRKIQLEVEVDAADAKAGLGEVKTAGADMAAGLAASSAKAGKSLDDLVKQAKETSNQLSKPGGTVPDPLKDIPEGSKRGVDALSRAERSMVQSIERTTAAFSAGSKSSSEYYRVLAQQRGIDPKILQPYLDALDKVAPKQKQVADAVIATVPAMQKYEMSAKATAAALRQVPAQVTDIVVGLQGGQAPLTVLLQQGGQLRDIFGSTGGAVRALGGFLGTLLTPLNVVLAATAGLGFAFIQGRKEAEEFNRALVLTGNFAGTSVGALQAMAASVAQATGATKGAAAEALTAFAAAGELGAASFERFGATAIRIQRETGVAVADTVKQFVALGKDPVSASVKLNETTNFLTLSLYRQIKALDDQGKSADAAALAQKAYADALDSRTANLAENLGTLEKVWRAVAGAAKGAWDAMLNVGRQTTPETRIAEITDRLGQIARREADRKLSGIGSFDTNTPERKALEQELTELSKRALLTQDVAAAEAARAQETKKRIQFDQDSAKVRREEATLEKELAQAKQKYFGEIAKGLITQKEYDTYIANIRAKYTDKGRPRADKGRPRADKSGQLDKASAAFDTSEIQRAFELQANAYANGDRILESLRSAGLLDDAAYFAAKRTTIEAVAALEEKALTEEIAREKQRVIIGATADERALSRLDRDKKVAELEQKLALSRANALVGGQLLGLQESAAADKISRSYADARLAAQEYFDTTVLGYARVLQARGRGDAANAFESGRNQITDKYESERNAAQRRFRSGPDNQQTRDELDQQLALIATFQGKALKAWEDHYSDIKRAETDWSKGSARALENYLDNSANIAKSAETTFTSAFTNMEDALVSFVTTGKLSFSKFADSLVADITRIIIKQQILAPLSQSIAGPSGLGGIFSTIFGSVLGGGAPPSAIGFGARANGGPVSAGGLYQVNERGPELLNVAGKQYLMMGSQAGSVTPNENIGRGNTVIVNLNQSFAQGTTRATTLQAAADARRQLEFAGRNL